MSEILERALFPLQRRVGLAIRSRVAGEDAPARARRIWGTAGDRWFGPDDPIWQVHADAAMFPGGICALLLQSLHPLAMAGVAGHSGYRGDMWGRLQRTSEYLATTTYGTVQDAERVIARVRAIHTRVRGVHHDGRRYAADDPRLLRWVHVAEVWSFLTAYQTFSRSPLTAEQADRYVAQTSSVAARLGARDLPQTRAAVEAQLEQYRPELQATPAARQAVRYLLFTPPLPLVARAPYATLTTGAIALLPPWARRALRLPMPGPLSAIARAIGGTGTGLVRWGTTAVEPGR